MISTAVVLSFVPKKEKGKWKTGLNYSAPETSVRDVLQILIRKNQKIELCSLNAAVTYLGSEYSVVQRFYHIRPNS